MITLRWYQERLVEASRDAFRAGQRRQVLVAPCRSGKTYTFAFMAGNAAARSLRVLVLAHREQLIEQASASFSALGIEHGLILSGRPGNGLPVQLGMIGTVARRLDRIAAPDLIIIDEGHRALGKQYRAILDAFPNARVLIFTATPARTDGRGLGEVADVLIQGPQPQELIDAGHICAPRIFVPPIDVDLSDIRDPDSVAGTAKAAARIDRPKITGDVIAHYRTYASGKPFIAFCHGVEHAGNVARQFAAAGIPTLNIDGTHTRDERREIMQRLRSGDVIGITSADLISEGVDLPSVHCTIHLRRTSSLIIFIQQYFRSLTPEPGKEYGIILDHVGNFDRFGFPQADRTWTLDGKSNHNKSAVQKNLSVRRCKKCFFVYETHLDKCPCCGAAAATESRTIEERDGVLVEVTDSMRAQEAAAVRKDELATVSYAEALARCETPEDFREMANARGYKSSWAILRVMDRFSVDKWRAAKMLGYKPGAAAHLRDRKDRAA